MDQGARLDEEAALQAYAANGWLALAVTLAIQIFTAAASTAPAVLAPEIARSFALPAGLAGVFVGIINAGGMAASLAAGAFIGRYGPIRVSQIGVLLCAAGIGLVAFVPAAQPLLLPLGAILIGVGYAPITPASSDLLVRTTPPARMAVTFSVKQTGVPVGGALAGATLPALALALGWRLSVLALALVGLCIAAMAQWTRRSLDGERSAGGPYSSA
ncbi:MAG: MFS transporter, partial [Deltaproteobacteria bacterium]|nr:MFS transporter [Deltaproteobacteria bacterium]